MKELRLSDFEWYKKRAKVHTDDGYFTCSEKKDVDQKIIFPLKSLEKHLTLSLSKKYLDLHVTNEDRSIPQRNILDINLRKSNRIIQKLRRPNDVIFIPFHDKALKKLILVNPYTMEFIKNTNRMDMHNIFPTTLHKARIRSMRDNHGKILVAYDVFGQFKGILKCNHHKGGFDFVPATSIAKFERKLVDPMEIKRRLAKEGLKENLRYKMFWQRWYKMIKLVGTIQKYASKFTRFIDLRKDVFNKTI